MWAVRPSDFLSARVPAAHSAVLVLDIESGNHDPGAFSASVCVSHFCLDGALFPGHQRNIVIAIDRRENPIASFFADSLHAHHERWGLRGIPQLRAEYPDSIPLFESGGRLHADCWQLANRAVIC